MSDPAFFSVRDGGVDVRLRVTPRASRDRIEGVRPDAAGAPVLRVSVSAPPEDGKANAAVIKLLAKTLRLPKTSISVRAGAAARDKTLTIAGDAAEIAARLRHWQEENRP